MVPKNRSRVNESPRPALLGGYSTMKRTRHTHEQTIGNLKTDNQLLAQDQTVADACRVLEFSQPTYHHYRLLYGGMDAEEAIRLSQLKNENARLKWLLAEAELNKAMLKGLVTP
jgi:putative transposase